MIPRSPLPRPRHQRWSLFAVSLLCTLLCLATASAQTGATFARLYSFRNDDSLGYRPFGRLLQGSDGALYGTTFGGAAAVTPGGAVFRLTRDGGTYQALKTFTVGGKSAAGLIQGRDGAFYGTSISGGSGGGGLVFRVTADGTYTVLHEFSYTIDGERPSGRLLQTADGTLYGTVSGGGPNGARNGSLFRLNPDGSNFRLLYTFPAGYGPQPRGALVQEDDGSFYGTAEGATLGGNDVAFRLNPDGTVTNLATFSYSTARPEGYSVSSELLRIAPGTFLGTTADGSPSGVIFKLTADGTKTTLYRFPAGPNGSRIDVSQLALGADGAYYGTTQQGGVNNAGTIFRFDGVSTVTTVYTFTGGTVDGSTPIGGLLLANDGNLYGVTANGGANNAGTVFRVGVSTAPTGTLQFAAESYNTTSNAGNVTVTVTRTGGSRGTASAAVSTADGTAFNGLDYTGVQVPVTWADGDTSSKTVTIPILNRPSSSEPRRFAVNLSGPAGATLGALSSTSVVIRGSDTLPTQPTATISSPQDDLRFVVGSPISLAATIADPAGALREVRFSLNDGTVATFAPGGPYVFDATGLAAGRYQFVVTVIDNFGRTAFASRGFTVVDEDAANPVPVSTVYGDYDNRLFSGGSVLVLSGTADVFGLTQAQLSQICFFYNGILIAAFDNQGNLLPGGLANVDQFANGLFGAVGFGDSATRRAQLYCARFRVPRISGVIRLTIVAVSNTGVSRTSGAVTVRADNSGAGSTVTGLTLASGVAPGTVVSAGTPIPFTVNVAGTAALVEYFVNGVKVGSTAQAPYTFSVPTPNGGTYLLNAVATDAAGLTTATDPLTVEVAAPVTVPTVNFALGDAVTQLVVAEGGPVTKAKLVRTGGDLSQPLTVSYVIRGDAVSGSDFLPLTGTVTFKAGKSVARIKVRTLRDGAVDRTRTVKLKLLPSGSGGYTLGTPSKAKVRILNVD